MLSLSKSIYDNYYTDCKCCKEFMNEIYILVIAPSKTTGRCRMENFRGERILTSWMKAGLCLLQSRNTKTLMMAKYPPRNKKKHIHDEIRSFDMLSKGEQEKDYTLTRVLVNMINNNLVSSLANC